MNCRLAALLAALALAAFVTVGAAEAADARLPVALYPPNTQLSYQPQLSNAEMDLDWGFSFDRHPGHNPLLQPRTLSQYHLRTQDQLHRLLGWSQLGLAEQHHRFTQFALYVSQYEAMSTRSGMPWSRQALLDFQLAAWLHGYRPLAHPPSLLPSSTTGMVVVMARRYGDVSVLLVGYESGTQEVEGMVAAPGGQAHRHMMWRDLVQQVRAVEPELP